MAQSYEQSFRKIAPLSDLPEGKARIFRAAGATVVLVRRGDAIEALDGSCVSDEGDTPAQVRLARILECVAAGLGEATSEWRALVEKGGLATRVENGWAWVCLERCRIDG